MARNSTRINIEFTARNLVSPVMRQVLRDLQRETARIERLNTRVTASARQATIEQNRLAQAQINADKRRTASANAAANARIQAERRATLAAQAAARAQEQVQRRGTLRLEAELKRRQRILDQQHRLEMERLRQAGRGGPRPPGGGPAGGPSGLNNLPMVARALDQLSTAIKWVVLYGVVRDVTSAIASIPATMIQANIETENALVTFKAFQGSAAAAASTLSMVRTAARATGQDVGSMATAARQLMPQFGKKGKELEHYLGTAQILGAMVPEQGLQGAAFAIAEAESGDFMSMRERFRMSLAMKNQLLAEGFTGAKAVDEWLRRMGVDFALVSEQQATFAGQWARLTGNAREFLRVVGLNLFKELRTGFGEINKLFSENEEDISRLANAWSEKLGAAIKETVTWLKVNGPEVFGYVKQLATDVSNTVNGIAEAKRIYDQVAGYVPWSPANAVQTAKQVMDYRHGVDDRYAAMRGRYPTMTEWGPGFLDDHEPGLVAGYRRTQEVGYNPNPLDYSGGMKPTSQYTPYGWTNGAFTAGANTGGISFSGMPESSLVRVRMAAAEATAEVDRLDKQLDKLGERRNRFGGLASDIKAGIDALRKAGSTVPQWMLDAYKRARQIEGQSVVQTGRSAAAAVLEEDKLSKLPAAIREGLSDLETQSMSVRATSVVIQGGGSFGNGQSMPRNSIGRNSYQGGVDGRGSYHNGTNFVSGDGLYNLLRGEVVLNRREVATAGGGNVTYIDNRKIAPVIHGEKQPTAAAAEFVRSTSTDTKYERSRYGHGALGSL